MQRRCGQGNVRQMRTQCGQRTEAADAVRTAGTNFLSAPSLFVTTSVNRAPLFYLSLRHILKIFMALHSVFCFCTETYNWLWFCRKLDFRRFSCYILVSSRWVTVKQVPLNSWVCCRSAEPVGQKQVSCKVRLSNWQHCNRPHFLRTLSLAASTEAKIVYYEHVSVHLHIKNIQT